MGTRTGTPEVEVSKTRPVVMGEVVGLVLTVSFFMTMVVA